MKPNGLCGCGLSIAADRWLDFKAASVRHISRELLQLGRTVYPQQQVFWALNKHDDDRERRRNF